MSMIENTQQMDKLVDIVRDWSGAIEEVASRTGRPFEQVTQVLIANYLTVIVVNTRTSEEYAESQKEMLKKSLAFLTRVEQQEAEGERW